MKSYSLLTNVLDSKAARILGSMWMSMLFCCYIEWFRS